MGRKPLTPLPGLLREKRLRVLSDYEDAQVLRRIESIRRQCDTAVTSVRGAGAAAQVAHESQVKVTESADSAVMKANLGPPPTFAGAPGTVFLRRPQPQPARKKTR